MNHSTSHSAWVLDRIIDIDAHHNGFAGAFMRRTTSDERRQVVAAFLAVRPLAEIISADLGGFLLVANHRSILAEAYRSVPEGLRGALRRAGPKVHEQRFYALLHELLSSPPHEHIRACIARLPSLDMTKLLILKMLPNEIARANLVQVLDDVHEAADVRSGLGLLVRSGVEGDELASAIRQVRNSRELSKLWQAWVLKAKAPPHPVPPCSWYRPVTTGAELHRLALAYRNCSRRYIPDLLDPEAGHAFAEVRESGRGAVVHLTRERAQWTLEGMYGPRNERPSRELADQIRDYLAQHGIVIERHRHRRSEWDVMRKLVAAPLFEFEF